MTFEGLPKTEVNLSDLRNEATGFEAGMAELRGDIVKQVREEFSSDELSTLDAILFNPNNITAGYLDVDDPAKLADVIVKMRELLSTKEDKKKLSAEIAKEIKSW